jgi:hypothetical protein
MLFPFGEDVFMPGESSVEMHPQIIKAIPVTDQGGLWDVKNPTFLLTIGSQMAARKIPGTYFC